MYRLNAITGLPDLVTTGGEGSGTVTSVSIEDANGFDGTVADSTTAAKITLETTVIDNRVLYALLGALTGDADFTYDPDEKTLTIGNITGVGGVLNIVGPWTLDGDAGEVGQVPTSAGPGVPATWQDPGAASYKSLSPYIVGSEFANFNTIQAAIDQAVLDGFDETDPTNVYIKSGTYIEDLNTYSGINLIGFDEFVDSNLLSDTTSPSAIIQGNHTITGSSVSIQNVTFTFTSGALFDFTETSSVYVKNSLINSNSFVGAVSLISITGSSISANLALDGVRQNNLTNDCVVFDNANLGASFSFTLNCFNCRMNNPGNSACDHGNINLFLIGGSFNWQHTCTADSTFEVRGLNCDYNLIGTCSASEVDSFLLTGGSIFGTMNFTTLDGSFTLTNCLLNITCTDLQPQIIDCITASGYNKMTEVKTSAYTTTLMDNFVPVDSSGGDVTITLYADPSNGMTQTIKDVIGSASTNNILIVGNIDTGTDYTINTDFACVTLVFNAESSTWCIQSQANTGSSGSYTSFAPWIVGDEFANYSDIQAANDAAVLAGVTNQTPINLYLKSKSTPYTGDYVLAAGVNLIGLDSYALKGQNNTEVISEMSVVIDGSITLGNESNSSINKIQNIGWRKDGGTMLVAGGIGCNLNMIECFMELAPTGTSTNFLAVNSGSNLSLNTYECGFLEYSGDSTLFNDSSLQGNLTFQPTNTRLQFGGIWNPTADVFVAIQGEFNVLNMNFDFTEDAQLNMSLNNSILGGSLWSCVNTGQIQFNQCNIQASMTFEEADSSTFEMRGCLIFPETTFPGSLPPKLIGCVGECCEYNSILSDIKTSDYTTSVTENVICVDTTSSAVTIALSDFTFSGMTQTIKDVAGLAGTNNIIVDGNGESIDGASTHVIDTDYGCATFFYGPDGGWKLMAQGNAGSSGGSYKSLAPYIVGDKNADYSTIQAAIDAIILEVDSGKSANLIIKPIDASLSYTEDLDFSSLGGIRLNIIGMNPSTSFNPGSFDNTGSPFQGSVSIFGNHTVSGNIFINGIYLGNNNSSNPGQPLFTNFGSVSLALNGVGINLTSASLIGAAESSPNFTLNIFNSQIDDATMTSSSLFDDDTMSDDLSSCSVYFSNSTVQLHAQSNCSKGNFRLYAMNSRIDNDIVLSGTTELEFLDFSNSTFSGDLVASSVGEVNLIECYTEGNFDFTDSGSGFFQLEGCTVDSDFQGDLPPQLIGCLGRSCGYQNIAAIQTSAYTTLINDCVIPVDTSAGAVTITLCTTPFGGMTQTVIDYGSMAATNNITVVGDINGNPSGLVMDQDNQSIVLTFNASVPTWMITSTTSSTGSPVDLHTAKFIVGDLSNGANYSSIATAIAAASTGDTIFIQNGNYSEDFTLPGGINLTGFGTEATYLSGGTLISGKITVTDGSTVTISNLTLETNLDYFLSVASSNSIIVNLVSCYLSCSNNDGIEFSSSSAASIINIIDCQGNITNTGFKFWVHTSAGSLALKNSYLYNSGLSTTATTMSAGASEFLYSEVAFPIETSSTHLTSGFHSIFSTTGTNTIAMTHGGDTGSNFSQCSFLSGSASCISISTQLSINTADIASSNTNCITGSGTLIYSGISFKASQTINTTTQVDSDGGTWTPVLKFGGVSTGITYSVQSGRYTRADSVVYFSGKIILTDKGSSTGSATIEGLPFVGGFTDVIVNYTDLSLTVGNLSAEGTVNSSVIALSQNNLTGTSTPLNDTNFADNSTVGITGFYFV